MSQVYVNASLAALRDGGIYGVLWRRRKKERLLDQLPEVELPLARSPVLAWLRKFAHMGDGKPPPSRPRGAVVFWAG